MEAEGTLEANGVVRVDVERILRLTLDFRGRMRDVGSGGGIVVVFRMGGNDEDLVR